MSNQFKTIENELGISLPESYIQFHNQKKNKIVNGLPIYGTSALKATELLNFVRPDLPNNYLVIRLLESQALCLDLNRVTKGDCPLIEVDFDSTKKPVDLNISFEQYVENATKSEKEVNGAFRRIRNLFETKQIKSYEHDSKGKRPPFKARDWQVIRSCVHDYVVGLTAFRFNEMFNGLEVDVFIATDHPEYERGHGIRALLSLLLSDAYKKGTSMEIRYTRFDNQSKNRVQDRIPNQLLNLFKENGISVRKAEDGIISHKEAITLYAHIVGITNDLIEIVNKYESQDRLSLQGVCFLISSRLWTIDEATWLLINTVRPEGILFGRDTPESRLKYEESLSIGRAVIAISKFRNKLENSLSDEGDTECQIENYLCHIEANQPAVIDWTITTPTICISKGEKVTILARPRRFFPLVNQLIEADTENLKSIGNQNRKFLIYSEEFLKINDYKLLAEQIKNQNNIEILILPFSTDELDEEVNNRMKKAKRIRT